MTDENAAHKMDKGAGGPRIVSVLSEFSDVLQHELPPAGPRASARTVRQEWNSYEHTIDVDPAATSTWARPLPFTQEEHPEIKSKLSRVLYAVWITPSLSPWSSPVLFVRKKPDPVTGVSSLRMCISYVKLSSTTLNRIAYRLPRISEL
jgi:hypothetical protein